MIVDRISHDIPFYRAFLKHAVLHGATVINNPFWWSADDKFFNYSLAAKLGVAAPPTVIPSAIPASGSQAAMAGSEARSGAALNAFCISQMPMTPAPTRAYADHLVNNTVQGWVWSTSSVCLVNAS